MFPEIYRATVSAGEQSGHLDAVLERLAEYTESREQMRQKVLGALLYPIVLTIMCFAHRLDPADLRGAQGRGRVRGQHAKLPLATRVLVGISGFLRNYGIWLLIALAAVEFLIWRALRSRATRRRFHRSLLSVPVMGKHRARRSTPRASRAPSAS